MAKNKTKGVQLRNARPYNWLDSQDEKDSVTKGGRKTQKKSITKKS